MATLKSGSRFHNLLSVITGCSELASMKLEEDDPMRSSLSEILQAEQRAASPRRQFPVFNWPQVIDLNAAVTDAEKMLYRRIGGEVQLTTAPVIACSSSPKRSVQAGQQ